jgi:hypothetical protein
MITKKILTMKIYYSFLFILFGCYCSGQNKVGFKSEKVSEQEYEIKTDFSGIIFKDKQHINASEIEFLLLNGDYYKSIPVDTSKGSKIWVFGKRVLESSELQVFQQNLAGKYSHTGNDEKKFYFNLKGKMYRVPERNQKDFYQKLFGDCLVENSGALKNTNKSNVLDIAEKYIKCKNESAVIIKEDPIILKMDFGVFGLGSINRYSINKPFSIVGDYIGEISMETSFGSGAGVHILMDLKNNVGLSIGVNFRSAKFQNLNADTKIPKFDFSVNYFELFTDVYYRAKIGNIGIQPYLGFGFSPYSNSLNNKLLNEYYKPDILLAILSVRIGSNVIYPVSKKINIFSGIGFSLNFIDFENTWGRNTELTYAQWKSTNRVFDFKLGVNYNLK